jgi:hypothetical protein
MPQKWNLGDIRPAGASKTAPKEPQVKRPQQDIARPQKQMPKEPIVDDGDLATIDVIDNNKLKRKRVLVTTLVILCILGIGYGINMLLGGAEVTVYPKIKDVTVQAEFTAYTQPKAGELGYELLILDAEGEKQVKANGKETVSERAQGKIFVYNTSTKAPQRLIKNTRFESKDGLIYRIKESIEVPTATLDAKSNLTPGSVVAEVFADGTGEQYNIEPGRFTVPGLKGSEQFDTIYGETTSPFSGGFEGERYMIDSAELDTAKQALHIELRDKLLARMKEERPAGFTVYDDAVTFTYDSLPSTEYGDELATIKEKATLRVPMFSEAQFSEYVAEKSIPDYTGEPVKMTDPHTLTFIYTSPTTTMTDISSAPDLTFTLKGTTRIVWQFDEEKLKNDLLGIAKSESTKVFASYPSIRNAEAKIKPFWVGTFPKSPKNIDVSTRVELK